MRQLGCKLGGLEDAQAQWLFTEVLDLLPFGRCIIQIFTPTAERVQ